MMNPTKITSNVARQILSEAQKNSVSVERYLNEIVTENHQNGHDAELKIRKTGTKVDLSRERQWLTENKDKYLGKWVVLDGDKLIGVGENPLPLVEQARKAGVKIPFMKFIENESQPFTGGWL